MIGCLSSPCKNGAQCVDLADGSYKCNCAVEFEGTNCEICKISELMIVLTYLKNNFFKIQ